MFTKVIDHNRLYAKGNNNHEKGKYNSNTNLPNQNKNDKDKARLNELLKSKHDKKNLTARSIIIETKTMRNKNSTLNKRGSGYFDRGNKENFLKNSNYHTISEKGTKGFLCDGEIR